VGRKDRDTYRYALRDGRDLVQFGVTEAPEARLAEHQRNHHKPNLTMTVEGPAVTREAALTWEADADRSVLPLPRWG
jgi:hypothetical protein